MRVQSILLCISLILQSGVAFGEEDKTPMDAEEVGPTIGEWPADDDGIIRINDADPKKLSSFEYIKYEYVRCKARWDQNCKGSVPIDAPAGWQICKPIYSETVKRGNAGYSFSPRSWYTNDPESPDRFRSLSLDVYAFGNHNPLNHRSAHIHLSKVGAKLLPADANNADRYREGCMMPSHD